MRHSQTPFALPPLRVAVLCGCLVLAACGGTTFRNAIYDDGVVRYRVGSVPASFRPIRVEDNDLAWHDAKLGTISINATCSDYEDVPEAALMNHLLFGTTQRSYRLEETVTLDGRGAHHVVAELELDGVPVTVEVYLIKKDGCVYDLSHIAGRDEFAAGVPVFTAFAQGFAVLATHLKK